MLQQTKTLSASLVQNNFGAIAKQIRDGDYKEIIVENRGKPIVAIVDIGELQAIKGFREQARQKEALNKLRALRTKIQARTKNKLTDEEAMKLANQFSHELIEDLAKTGKVKFERKTA